MKKILSKIVITICMVVVGLVLPTSCEQQLETEIYGELTPEAFYKTEGDLKAALVGLMIYVSGRGVGTDYGLWTGHVVTPKLVGDMVSDELWSSWSDYANWNWTPASGNENAGGGRPEYNWAIWLFNRIAGKCTAAMYDMENSPVAESNPEIVEEYVKQLKGLRALYMYTCYQFFGPVNTAITYEETLSTEEKARMTDAEYTAVIESDLAAVLESELPDKQTGGDHGYISKDFFRMLAIRYYMTTGQWSKAEDLCRYIMTTGNYSLITQPGETVDYVDLEGNSQHWTYTPYEVAVNTCPNDETIFSCPADGSHGNIWITEATASGTCSEGPGTGKTLSGWGIYAGTWEHLHSLYGYYAGSDDAHTADDPSWANDDRRRAWWVSQYKRVRHYDDEGNRYYTYHLANENPDLEADEIKLQGPIPVKFTNWFTSSYSEFEIEQPAYRLSDVYLYLAECIVRQDGVTQEAIDLVADIRERAGLGRDLTQNLTPRQLQENPDPTSGSEAFLDFILWERGRELFGEGQRWEDLRRHGMLAQRAFEQNRITDPAANEFRYYIALPDDIVLQGNGVVLQNPGYTSQWPESYPESELKHYSDD